MLYNLVDTSSSTENRSVRKNRPANFLIIIIIPDDYHANAEGEDDDDGDKSHNIIYSNNNDDGDKTFYNTCIYPKIFFSHFPPN